MLSVHLKGGFPVPAGKLLLCFLFFPRLLGAQLSVTSLQPAAGPVGSTISLKGTGFGTLASEQIVYFGSVRALVSSATAAELKVTVPAGASAGPVTVTRNGRTAAAPVPFFVTFPEGGVLEPVSLAPEQTAATGRFPFAVALADLDGDGRTDLATANNANDPASTVSVLRNTGAKGNLEFAPKVDFPSGQLPYFITASDIDGDGKQDLLTTSIFDKTVSVYRNTSTPGTITLAGRVGFATGDNPYSIAAGDLDADGRPDLAVANHLSGRSPFTAIPAQ
ncbi:MAG TPA: FG-GAP-like repeat-containing protein [Chitinophagaceae bacterium]|nr:FG-GAP-like repeat-containing protein [Chitinophagaceae bacterium]